MRKKIVLKLLPTKKNYENRTKNMERYLKNQQKVTGPDHLIYRHKNPLE